MAVCVSLKRVMWRSEWLYDGLGENCVVKVYQGKPLGIAFFSVGLSFGEKERHFGQVRLSFCQNDSCSASLPVDAGFPLEDDSPEMNLSVCSRFGNFLLYLGRPKHENEADDGK